MIVIVYLLLRPINLNTHRNRIAAVVILHRDSEQLKKEQQQEEEPAKQHQLSTTNLSHSTVVVIISSSSSCWRIFIYPIPSIYKNGINCIFSLFVFFRKKQQINNHFKKRKRKPNDFFRRAAPTINQIVNNKSNKSHNIQTNTPSCLRTRIHPPTDCVEAAVVTLSLPF